MFYFQLEEEQKPENVLKGYTAEKVFDKTTGLTYQNQCGSVSFIEVEKQI